MRNVILAVVAIAALTAAGVGGVFADFSDIEISEDNYFSTAALDLKVSDYMGNEYQDPNVPAFCQVSDAWPCCDKSFFFDLENYGQGDQKIPWLYIHFKNFECGWVVPKNVWKWIDADCNEVAPPAPPIPPGAWVEGMQGTGYPKPVNEPEYVAECGGIAGELADGTPVVVPGIGCCYGEDCHLPEHIGVAIQIAGPYPDELKPKPAPGIGDPAWVPLDLVAMGYDKNGDGEVKLDEIKCEEIELGELLNNYGLWVHVMLHFQDFDEEDAFALDLISTTYFDETIPAEKKWDHWPTNALQKDLLFFDISFELLQTRVP